MLTEEQYEYIKQYADTYKSAKEKNYAHILPRNINERLNEIIGGPKKNWGCSACCLTLYRQLYTVLQNEEATRQQKQRELQERMAKAREAKKNKQNITPQEEDATEKRPEQSDE